MHALVRAHKDWVGTTLRDIAARAGHKRPETVAQQLLALWDGETVEAFIQRSLEPIRASRQAAATSLRRNG
jgi:hypothetical protein